MLSNESPNSTSLSPEGCGLWQAVDVVLDLIKRYQKINTQVRFSSASNDMESGLSRSGTRSDISSTSDDVECQNGPESGLNSTELMLNQLMLCNQLAKEADESEGK